ncbi:MAG: nucleotidyl transferase AbiEii/AbiGii toxin family protein [Acidimicrobiales bacterium]
MTKLLRSLIRPLPDNSGGSHVAVVFKGGTSLSKVYRLVDRFSEDVDILLVCESVGTGQRDRVLKYGADAALDCLAHWPRPGSCSRRGGSSLAWCSSTSRPPCRPPCSHLPGAFPRTPVACS